MQFTVFFLEMTAENVSTGNLWKNSCSAYCNVSLNYWVQWWSSLLWPTVSVNSPFFFQPLTWNSWVTPIQSLVVIKIFQGNKGKSTSQKKYLSSYFNLKHKWKLKHGCGLLPPAVWWEDCLVQLCVKERMMCTKKQETKICLGKVEHSHSYRSPLRGSVEEDYMTLHFGKTWGLEKSSQKKPWIMQLQINPTGFLLLYKSVSF